MAYASARARARAGVAAGSAGSGGRKGRRVLLLFIIYYTQMCVAVSEKPGTGYHPCVSFLMHAKRNVGNS
jgi:hypothetical protein